MTRKKRGITMIINSLIFNVAILFIMTVPGIVLKKCRLADGAFGKGISNLVLYVAQPALILYTYVSCESDFASVWKNALATLIISIPVHIIFALAAMLCFKKVPDGIRRMLRFATTFSNAAFMGVPLVQIILGSEAAIYASIYNITFNFFLWTLGVYFCTHKEGEDVDGDGDYDLMDMGASAVVTAKKAGSLKKVLLHPVTLASVIGVILLALGVDTAALEAAHLGIISSSLDMLRGLVAPLSMVVIGLRLPDVDFRGIHKDVNMFVFLALRHLVLPFAVIGLLYLLKLTGLTIGSTVIIVTVIMAAAPAASSATMFAEKFDCDAAYVSRLVVVSTLLSIGTMPLMIYIADFL